MCQARLPTPVMVGLVPTTHRATCSIDQMLLSQSNNEVFGLAEEWGVGTSPTMTLRVLQEP